MEEINFIEYVLNPYNSLPVLVGSIAGNLIPGTKRVKRMMDRLAAYINKCIILGASDAYCSNLDREQEIKQRQGQCRLETSVQNP